MLRSVKYGLNGAVLAGLIAVPTLWSTVDKKIDLIVDGRSQAIQTTAANVGQVVKDAGYRVTAHDLLAPTASSHIKDGTRIVLRRGRLLHLNVDGSLTSVWTTAPTVSQALAELGYPASDFVSVSRSRRLPLGVTDISIRTPRVVTIVHDGHREQVSTTEQTVGEMLADLGIPLGTSDRLSVAASSAVVGGETVRIQRVSKRTITRTRTLPFPVTKRRDSSLAAGVTKIIRPGKRGQLLITYAQVFVDGRMVGQTRVRSVVVAAPRRQIESIGTRQRQATITTTASAPSEPLPSPGSAKAIARQLLADRGWGSTAQYDCLVTLWDHESGWNVHASNPSGAYGIPQALPGSKMSTAGPDWQNSATTQIEWGLGYIGSRYGTPCGAWSSWQANGGWY